MNGNKSKNALGRGGAFAVTLAVVAVMFACPFAVSDFSDAYTPEDVDVSEVDTLPALEGSTFSFDKNYNTSGNYTINHSITIDGCGYILYGGFSFDSVADDGEGEYNVTITDLTLDGVKNTDGFGISSGNEKDESVRAINLTLDGCTIKNFSSKGLYMTSVKPLKVVNCTFENNAYKVNQDRSDYAFDVNLIGVQGATIEVSNCTFSGECGSKSVMKITQRGGSNSTDDLDNGFSIQTSAKINNVVIKDNTFSPVNTERDITFGSGISNTAAGNKSYTSAFDVQVISKGPTVIAKPTAVGKFMDIQLAAGSTFTSTSSIAEGDGTSDNRTTGTSAYTLESGSAVISGYIPSTTSLSIAQGASASVGAEGLKSDGMIYIVNNNLSGSVDGKVQNTDVAVNPGYDDDEDLPPYIPSQFSNDDDTVTIVACAAAAAVAAILAVFLVIDRKG